MGAALPYQSDCCTSCDEPNIQNVPGPAGSDGADGADGSDGVNAYTTLTAQFLMPDELTTYAGVKVADSSWMVVGQILYVQTAGYMQVTAVTDVNTISLKNLEDTPNLAYPSNAAPTTPIAIGSKLSPGGIQGVPGNTTGDAGGDLEGDYPNPTLEITQAKGDLIVNNNAGVAPRNTRLPAGTNGMVLHSLSTEATGLKWSEINLADSAEVTGALPIVNGGTGQITQTDGFNALAPTTTKGDISAHDGSDNIRLAVGSDGQVLSADSAQATGLKYDFLGPANFGPDAEEVICETIILRDRKTSGSDGDSSSGTPGSWAPRDITEISTDTSGTVTLAAHTSDGVTGNKFTLVQGFYRISAQAVGYQIGYHKIRLWNVTNGAVQPYAGGANPIIGTTAKSPAASDNPTLSVLEGRFEVIDASEQFCIQHYAELGSVSAGYGKAASIAAIEEVYLIIRLEKLAKTA